MKGNAQIVEVQRQREGLLEGRKENNILLDERSSIFLHKANKMNVSKWSDLVHSVSKGQLGGQCKAMGIG